MSTVFTIIAFVVIFSLLILIHEAGHFFAAKKSGVKVEEFGMGIPPRIWGFKKGETIYSINWIPFGGFVRTLGEGDDSKEGKTSKRSFANQSLRVQAFIVCAGVMMNLLLAFVLLTIGFWIGIEPLIADQDDFLAGVRSGQVQVEPGVVVLESNQPYNTVDYNGEDLQVRSFEVGDRLLGFETVEEWEAVVQAVQEGGEAPMISMDRADGTGGGEYLTKELLEQTKFAPFYLSGLIYEENPNAVFSGVLQQGDVLVSVKDPQRVVHPLLTAEDLDMALKTLDSPLVLTVFRPSNGTFELDLTLPQESPVVSFVEPESPADLAGIAVGDRIQTVGGRAITKASQVVEYTQEFKQTVTNEAGESSETIDYTVIKGEEVERIVLTLRPEDGRVGVGIADIVPSFGMTSVYEGYVPYTLMEIQKTQLGWSAPVVALSEMWRLGKITAVTFVGVLKQFVTAGGVPEGVSGPVGIAQMTGVTIQDGFAATLRFIAMLSLSLGVINILPFPALDGGHFAGILFQAITGKKGSTKWTNLINTAGYIFLLLFIAYVTFNDVLNLF